MVSMKEWSFLAFIYFSTFPWNKTNKQNSITFQIGLSSFLQQWLRCSYICFEMFFYPVDNASHWEQLLTVNQITLCADIIVVLKHCVITVFFVLLQCSASLPSLRMKTHFLFSIIQHLLWGVLHIKVLTIIFIISFSIPFQIYFYNNY